MSKKRRRSLETSKKYLIFWQRPNDVYCALRMRHSVQMISVKSSYDIRNGTFSLDASAIKHLFCLPTNQPASTQFYHHKSCHLTPKNIVHQFQSFTNLLAPKGALFLLPIRYQVLIVFRTQLFAFLLSLRVTLNCYYCNWAHESSSHNLSKSIQLKSTHLPQPNSCNSK